MVPILAAWCGGIVLFLLCPWLPPRWLVLLLASVSGAALWVTRLRPPALCLLGACWSAWHALALIEARVPLPLEGAAVRVAGEIRELPVQQGKRIRFHLEGARRQGRAGWPLAPVTLRLADYAGTEGLAAGSRCSLHVRLKRVRGTRSTGAFDLEQWAHASGIAASGYVVAHPANHCEPLAFAPIVRARAALTEAITRSVAPAASASVLAALAVGARADIADEQWRILRDTGVIHVISVSGLHVAMVALGLHGIARAILALFAVTTGRRAWRWLAAVIAFAGAALYALIAGFTVPTQRTLVMIAIALLNHLRGRALFSMESLLLAAAVVLLISPTAGLTLSFWLSFGAVALMVLQAQLQRASTWQARWFGVHLALALLFAPMLAWAFQSVPLASPLANALAVPVVTLTMVPLLLLGCLTWLPAPSLSGALWVWAGRIWDGVWWGLLKLESLSPVLALDSRPHGLLVPLGILAAALVCGPLRAARLPWAFAIGLLFLVPLGQPPAHGEFETVVFDVGQGLSVLVRTRAHTLLYDTGARFPEGGDQSRAVVLPWLRAHGIASLDLLMVSHADLDHAGGISSLHEALAIKEELGGEPVASGMPASRRCERGAAWRWEGVAFEILHPAPGSRLEGNDASCVLRVVSSTGSLLLTGDITAQVERSLLREDDALGADVLLLPHHGSRTSSSRAFLAEVKPELAVISAGYRNPFAHPAPEVLESLDALEIASVSTVHEGTLRIFFAREGLQVESTRRGWPRHWDPSQ
jgi:competence protein ComEC